MLDLEAELRFHALLEQALACGEAERQVLLDSLADEPHLVAELQLCLEDEDDDLAGGFLEKPAVDPADITTEAELHRAQPVPRHKGPARQDWRAKIKAPRRVGPYELIEPRGTGGMGKVYSARRRVEKGQPLEEHPVVALKVLRGSLAETALQEHFKAGIQRLSLLRHPNLATIHDGGIDDEGHPFYASEWVEGVSVTRFAEQQRSTLQQRLELMSSVCRGLEFAGRQGVNHLGIKPSNVLVVTTDASGEDDASNDGGPVPKVTDIGIAEALDHSLTESAVLTRGGLDTALYISPEAIDGSRGAVDSHSDVYALGILLFELLLGALPVETRSASLIQVVMAIRQGDVITLGNRWQELDPATRQQLAEQRQVSVGEFERFLSGRVEAVVAQAMAKEKAERQVDVAALRQDLERIAAEL